MISVDNQSLFDQFKALVALPGVSGQERVIAHYLREQFSQLGWQTWIDGSGSRNDSNSGNLYALLEVDSAAPTVAFCAHMDTVIKPGQKVTVKRRGNLISSDGTTILGADDRAGICALLLTAQSFATSRPSKNILYFFSTREEAGVMGSTLFNYPQKLQYIFNLDGTDKPGVFITQSLGYLNFSISIVGRAAHAAKDYQKGKSAIVAAGHLLQRLPHGGSRKDGWTCNIGTIQGGSGLNVIPDKVVMQGEMRAFNSATFSTLQQQVTDSCRQVAQAQGVTINYQPDAASYTPPFSVSPDSDIKAVCRQACRQLGLRASFQTAYSTSDANHLAQTGVPTLTIARGGANVHSSHETIQLSDIATTVEIVKALARF